MPSMSVTGSTIHDLRPAALRAAPIHLAPRQDAAIDVTVERIQDPAHLAAAWNDLAARTTHSFYLSWLWIEMFFFFLIIV